MAELSGGWGPDHLCCGPGLDGRGRPSWALSPPTTPQPPGGSRPSQAGFGKVAGRGLLESCLLSRGLISKTGRLILTEAADGTPQAPARLSSLGPPPPAPTLGGLPAAPALQSTRSHSLPQPLSGTTLCRPGLGERAPQPALPTAGGLGGQESGGEGGPRVTGLAGRVSHSRFANEEVEAQGGK